MEVVNLSQSQNSISKGFIKEFLLWMAYHTSEISGYSIELVINSQWCFESY